MGNVRYDIQTPPLHGSSARLLYCAFSRYDGSWQSIPHSHAHAELFCCTGGKGMLHIAGGKLPLTCGDCFLINPGVAHTEHSDPSDLLEYIVIGVGDICFLDENGSQPRYHLIGSTSGGRELLPYFQDMLQEASLQREGYLSVCESITSILLVKASRRAQVSAVEPTATPDVHECAEVKRLIDERYAEPWTLGMLSEHAHISKYYLTRAFHARYGEAPMHYLARRRLREACHLLQNTDYSLAEICSLTGFSSPSYFSQVFRRLMGTSPSEYRKARSASR